MSNTKLQIIIEKDELDTFREILKIANRDYVLNYKEENPYSDGSTLFTIECPLENAPMAYWHLGILDAYHRLSKRKQKA